LKLQFSVPELDDYKLIIQQCVEARHSSSEKFYIQSSWPG